jgi:hypothetical protein
VKPAPAQVYFRDSRRIIFSRRAFHVFNYCSVSRTRLINTIWNFSGLVTRWEYQMANFFGMVRLGCIKLLLRYL